MRPPQIETSTEKIRNLPMRIISAWSGVIWMCPGITGNSCHCLKGLFQSWQIVCRGNSQRNWWNIKTSGNRLSGLVYHSPVWLWDSDRGDDGSLKRSGKGRKVRALGASAMYGYQFYNMQLVAKEHGCLGSSGGNTTILRVSKTVWGIGTRQYNCFFKRNPLY